MAGGALRLVVVAVALLSAAFQAEGTPAVEFLVNPHCPACNTTSGSIVLLQYRAQPSLVFLWSTIGRPTIFTLSCTGPVSLSDFHFDWAALHKREFKPGSVLLPAEWGSVDPASLVLHRVMTFNDTNGTAAVSDAAFLAEYDFAGASWQAPNTGDAAQGIVRFNTTDGAVQLELRAHLKKGHDKANPKLLYSPNSTSFSLALSKTRFPKNSYGKLAIDLRTISFQPKADLVIKKSINDENTPSVFTTDIIQVAEQTSYLMWKPVAYGTEQRKPANGTFATPSAIKQGQGAPGSIALSLFPAKQLTWTSSNVSFGEPDDGLYEPQLMVFDAVFGAGQAPKESFSPALLTTLIATLATPGAAFLFGGLYVMYKRTCAGGQQKDGYQGIN